MDLNMIGLILFCFLHGIAFYKKVFIFLKKISQFFFVLCLLQIIIVAECFCQSEIEIKKRFARSLADIRQQRVEQGIAEFERLIKMDPQGEFADDAKFEIADWLFREKRYSEAELKYKEIINSYPDSKRWKIRCFRYTSAYPGGEAWDKQYEKYPVFTSDLARVKVGEIYFIMEKYKDAISLLKPLSQKYDNDPEWFKIVNKKFRCDFALYRPERDAKILLARCYNAMEMFSRAIEELRDFQTKYPNSYQVRRAQIPRWIAEYYAEQEDYSSAIKELDDFKTKYPNIKQGVLETLINRYKAKMEPQEK